MGPDRNLVVGLFVLVAILIGFALTAWITGQRGSEVTERYYVMINSDVSGLMLGGPVFFMGVQVGAVDELVIVHGNPAMVRVELNVDAKTPIDTGTWATLAAQGITGVSVVNLSASPGDHSPLEVEPGQDLPVIPYRDSGFSALLSSAPAVVEKLDTLLDNANALLGPDNQTAITHTLDNIQTLTDTLMGKADAIAALPGALNETLDEIGAVTDALNNILEEGGPSATQTLANLDATSANLQGITARLDTWMTNYNDDVRRFSEDGLAQVPELLDDTRDTLEELDNLLESLRRNPSQVLYRPAQNEIEVEE